MLPKSLCETIASISIDKNKQIEKLEFQNYILKIDNNNPKNKDADNNFKVTTVAPKSLGKLVNIKSKSINTPCYT